MTMEDRSVMRGQWVEGVLEGEGNIIYQDQSILTGNY